MCTCLAQLSMFHMEKRSRNTLIIIILLFNIISAQTIWHASTRQIQLQIIPSSTATAYRHLANQPYHVQHQHHASCRAATRMSCYLPQPQHTDTWPTSPSMYSISTTRLARQKQEWHIFHSRSIPTPGQPALVCTTSAPRVLQGSNKNGISSTAAAFLFVACWLLNVPATCQCISGTDLLRQFYEIRP